MTIDTLKLLVLGSLLAFSLSIAGCGGSGSSDNGAPGGGTPSGTPSGTPGGTPGGTPSAPPTGGVANPPSGSVAVFLTDAPADLGQFRAVNLSLGQVELLPEGGGSPVALGAAAVNVNLLDLTHTAMALGYRESVPAGRYCRVRLKINSIELVLSSGGRENADLPARGVLTLVPRNCVEVASEAVVHLQLDFDVAKSLHKSGDRFELRPVFHADVIHSALPSRLVRLEGRIVEFRGVDQVFLCGAVPVRRDEDDDDDDDDDDERRRRR